MRKERLADLLDSWNKPGEDEEHCGKWVTDDVQEFSPWSQVESSGKITWKRVATCHLAATEKTQRNTVSAFSSLYVLADEFPGIEEADAEFDDESPRLVLDIDVIPRGAP